MDLLHLEQIIKTQLSVRVPQTIIGYTSDEPPVPVYLIDKFPDITFGDEITDDVPKFPYVYIHELEPSEVGNSLENNQIHALRDTVQIEATINTSKTDARLVINSCITAMKKLRYTLVTGAVYTKSNNLHRYVIRMRRVVASGDVF